MPVIVDEAFCEDEKQSESGSEGYSMRKTFLDSMLNAQNVSRESFARIDQVRHHRVKGLKDLDELKKHKQIILTSDLEEKQCKFEARRKKEDNLEEMEYRENKMKGKSECIEIETYKKEGYFSAKFEKEDTYSPKLDKEDIYIPKVEKEDTYSQKLGKEDSYPKVEKEDTYCPKLGKKDTYSTKLGKEDVYS